MEEIILPQNAETFLNTEAEYLRYCHDWEDGMSLEDVGDSWKKDI